MEARIVEVTGVMPDTVNGYSGFRVFCTLDQQVHARGSNVHVFAQKPDRWKAGNTVIVDTPSADFFIGGPGEETLTPDEVTYLYAKLSLPKKDGAGYGGQKRFVPQQAPTQAPRGFTPAQAPAKATPASAPAAAPCATVAKPRLTAAEADVAYDQLLAESLRAVGTILEGYFGAGVESALQDRLGSSLRAELTATLAGARATAIFAAQAAGAVSMGKAATIQALVNGLDADTGADMNLG
jgi:hypothetical protein